jgi:hypothetical protein
MLVLTMSGAMLACAGGLLLVAGVHWWSIAAATIATLWVALGLAIRLANRRQPTPRGVDARVDMASRQRIVRIVLVLTLFIMLLPSFVAVFLAAGIHWWSIALAAIFELWVMLGAAIGIKWRLRTLAPKSIRQGTQ